ncbi:FMN-dependent NADH-azoreductase [Parasphingorhabdus marina DSM 22363]|uniref:FMN dependent NADH:quinone oxidoreductase n=1 Tax=Parasphingorhabdus marina DSM 22363 TaxID=1123272 RepID=A0A1N6D9C6_9SPHN|nr:NAD(P)H-dependent oxidoreductase [Parasphingorhabdus marina]SIN67402.1 FMN-dependent NADH-azoreductase [Parasphingorhabdus marina DSM 22363]
MTQLLRIDASARTSRSLTRSLADKFTDNWMSRRPHAGIVQRDVGRNPPPIISEDWIAAAFAKTRSTEQERLLALSDKLIAEVNEAQLIVLAAPMYNYGMPAALKAWFDQVVRIDKTFTFDLARGDTPLKPVFSGKILVLLTSWGEFGFGPGEHNEGRDNLTPHVRTASQYLGVEEFHHIGIEYQEFGDGRFEASRKRASAAVELLVERLIGKDEEDAEKSKAAA